MQEHIIRKEDGTIINWNKTKNNGYFCLLHNDNKQKYSFTPVQNLKCQLFMIGGGGAGGYFFGGGGGAGAAYINNNYVFEKNKSYSFEIGTGGKCDIDNLNNLFKSGLNLKVFNNTTPKLNNISFTNDDYASIGITQTGIVQSFIVNNINIPATIFNNNTTYIWDGYVKPNDSGFIKININSKIKTIVWVDKYVFDTSSALVDSNNISDVKVIQLDANKFYNIKIIAYNFDTSNANFNINFENCKLYNFDKTNEIYNYTPATDTNLIYRNADNTAYIIKCKGGGSGGCGLYNQNTNLDGGCGGGSGINKKNGKSVIEPSFNGNDGAIGTYCGGGGGIMSPGNNDKGGQGKIIEWFKDDLIFGAGGNAATFKETRNLGYGCGGNGAECCYFSKLLINNDGNNGCILIYVNDDANANGNANVNANANANANGNVNGNVIEGFAEYKKKTAIYIPYNSIVKSLIETSFLIAKYDNNNIATNNNRKDYFNTLGYSFAKLCSNETNIDASGSPITPEADNNNMHNFIYDMLVIGKLYAVVYRLYYYQYTIAFNNNTKKFKDFLNNLKYTFNDAAKTNITGDSNTGYTVNICKLFEIDNLKLDADTSGGIPSYYKTNIYTDENKLNMSSSIYDASL
jgi:hypothetical protein